MTNSPGRRGVCAARAVIWALKCNGATVDGFTGAAFAEIQLTQKSCSTEAFFFRHGATSLFEEYLDMLANLVSE